MTHSPSCSSVPEELVDLQLVSSRTVRVVVGGLSRRALCKWIKAGLLPRPISIGGLNYWRVTVIRAWLVKHVGEDAAAKLATQAA